MTLHTVFVVVVCLGALALWLAMVVNFSRLLKLRKPGVARSLWLIYQPSLLTEEGARALRRYWLFGVAAVIWFMLGLFFFIEVVP